MEFGKDQFARELTQTLIPGIREGFTAIFARATELCDAHGTPHKVFATFQNFVAEIHKWIDKEKRADELTRECERILKRGSSAEYIEELLHTVFSCYLRCMLSAALPANAKPQPIEIEVPDFETFVYHVYVQAARAFWKQPTLFRRVGKRPEEIEANILQCEKIIDGCILDEIRRALPMKKILQVIREAADDAKDNEVPAAVVAEVVAPKPTPHVEPAAAPPPPAAIVPVPAPAVPQPLPAPVVSVPVASSSDVKDVFLQQVAPKRNVKFEAEDDDAGSIHTVEEFEEADEDAVEDEDGLLEVDMFGESR
jgi:hypothetical protein